MLIIIYVYTSVSSLDSKLHCDESVEERTKESSMPSSIIFRFKWDSIQLPTPFPHPLLCGTLPVVLRTAMVLGKDQLRPIRL